MNIVRLYTESNIYHMLPREKQKLMQQRRLKKLVAYVKKNSPKLAELYANIGDDFSIEDLPVTNKQMIMENYDTWATDREISFEKLIKFTEDKSNIGVPFLDKYIVASTSGSTGYPLIYLLDQGHYNSASLINKYLTHHPICMICSSSSFLISTGVLLESMRRFPFTKKYLNLIDSTLPTKKLVEKLNEIQPKSIFSYVSTMELLADEYKKGSLKINPKQIICCAEKLPKSMRKYLKDVFGCDVKSVYACTEGGNIAYQCDCGHFHLFNDWNIIEPVDADNNPVPFGQKSEKILLTNLANRTMPIIRYEVTDQITMHNDRCECGKKGLWFDVEGRAFNQALIFKSGDEEVRISSMLLYVMLETMETIRLFQLILHGHNSIELRINFMPNVDEAAVFEEAKTTLTNYLHSNDVDNVEIYLSDKQPQIDPKTLKLKTVYQEF